MTNKQSEYLPQQRAIDRLFLPDFCNLRTALAVMVVAQLLAFVLVLSPTQNPAKLWDNLGMLSLFIQWVALSSAVVLCTTRRWLVNLNNTQAGIISYLLVLLVTVISSEVAVWIIHYIGLPKSDEWHAHFLIRNLIISSIVGAVALRLFYLQHQERLHQEIESGARIQALQARIRPHFLFNSMNTIAALIRTQPEHAEEAVEDLSELFRASLNDASHMITLEAEFETAKRYLQIEHLRLGDRLRMEWDIDELPMSTLVPALILQPLLENAIYHGIEGLPEGGIIRVSGKNDGDIILITITNPVPESSKQTHAGNQIAMDNIKERLNITYKQKGNLQISIHDQLCCVVITLPALEQVPGDKS